MLTDPTYLDGNGDDGGSCLNDISLSPSSILSSGSVSALLSTEELSLSSSSLACNCDSGFSKDVADVVFFLLTRFDPFFVGKLGFILLLEPGLDRRLRGPGAGLDRVCRLLLVGDRFCVLFSVTKFQNISFRQRYDTRPPQRTREHFGTQGSDIELINENLLAVLPDEDMLKPIKDS